MPSYSVKPENPDNAAWTKGDNLRVHFKNTRETGMALKGKSLKRAQQYLKNVISQKESVPFRRFNGGVGRKAKGKNNAKTGSQCRFPKKSAEILLNLLTSIENNATAKDLPIDDMQITHVSVKRAANLRRRTYRAHGRIGPYLCSPCHVEIIATAKSSTIPSGELVA